MLRLHTIAPMRLSQAALPVLVKRGRGAIVNVSSVASFVYSAGSVNYCATKAYLTNFSEGLAAELRGTGVRVQALCPGLTRSEFHERMKADAKLIPGWMWLSARQVVQSSLRNVRRRGPVVCIPGVRYKLMVFVLRYLPRSLIGWASRQRSTGM